MPYVVTDTCILCGACVVGCESEAITEGETQSYIDINICVECGTCERNCPTESIIYIDDAEYFAQQNSQPAEPPALNTAKPVEQPTGKNIDRASNQSASPSPFV